MSTQLILMENINKEFPGVQALSEARFDLNAGEVHALVGENGAGKSTLMKVLTGIYTADSGIVTCKGKPVDIRSPRAAQNLGISMIHQELNLMPDLTVAQNVFIGREPRASFPLFLHEKQINKQTAELLATLHLNIDPRAKVSKLSVAKQQMVEIAKALSYQSDVLIMDEPTAALTDSEIQELFAMIRRLREQGVGIVYISHRMEELKQISDRVTVMRDGHYIQTANTAEIAIEEIIRLMVGRTIYESSPEIPENPSQDVILEVRNLNAGTTLKNVNFTLKQGEILGVAGLMGAGRTEVARAVIGADPVDSIEVYVHGKHVRIKSPGDAVKHGIGYLSEDRKRYGVVVGMNVESNVVMASFRDFLNMIGAVKNRKVTEIAQQYVKVLAIKTPSVKQQVRNLSGGNQQKVVIAKWLIADSDILIFDEPTRGIDVGAKGEIYRLLNELVAQGKSIIMISSELPEILRMSHRILVMCEGRISGELTAEEATQEKIMTYATQREEINR